MISDKQRWDEKYAARDVDTTINADPLLLRYAQQLPASGRALDVAAGTGDNACLLAQLGYESFAVDISFTGLMLCRAKARANSIAVYPFVADLSRYPLPVACFDIVVVMHFLDRALLPQLKTCVRPQGWLIYKTFNRSFLQHKPEFPQDYVLADDELRTTFAGWELLESNEDATNTDSNSYWVGRKPA